MSRWIGLSASLALAAVSFTSASTAQSSAPSAVIVTEPSMQLPPDQIAFKAAIRVSGTPVRIAALEAFLKAYPKSKQVAKARQVLLNLLVEQQPQDEARIHEVAKAIVDAASPEKRHGAENDVAFTLAEAPPNGVDLRSAEAWAREAVESETFEMMAVPMRKAWAEAKVPLSEEKVRKSWAEEQGDLLQTLADVYFHEGKLREASATLDKAQADDPSSGSLYASRGQVLHAEGHEAQALDALEQAEAYGGNVPVTQALLHQLYAKQAGGKGLEAEVDRRYAALHPPFVAPSRIASPTRRTVLMELYTGSACNPCTAADLALDAVLKNYSRGEVVALALDMHHPAPDPLANAATLGRADYESVQYTPTVHIDGEQKAQDALGGDRDAAADSYAMISAELDKQLGVPSGASLQLTAIRTPAQTVAVTATVHLSDANALRKLLETPEAASADEVKAKAVVSTSPRSTSSAVAPAKVPKLTLNFALVQKEIRYSGTNGIRLHHMVVRDLAKPTADGFPVAGTADSTASFTFDPAAVSAKLNEYLANYEMSETAHFLQTDTTLQLNDLAVAAWVEDLMSHRIVAAAYSLVASPEDKAAR